MTAAVWLWGAAGLGAGAVHAAALWRTSHEWKRTPLATLWRLPLVVALLVTAAIAHHLLPAAAGWAGGLAAGGTFAVVRSRR